MTQHLNMTDSTVLDSTTNNNDGTSYGASSTDGQVGKAESFDGTNDYVDTAAINLGALTAFTITGWLNVNAVSGTFLEKGNLDDFLLYWGGDGKLSANIWISGVQRVADTPESLVGVGWIFVTVTWLSGSTIKVYYNSVLKAESAVYSGVVDNQVSSLRLGRCKNNNNPLNGIMDEGRIYNQAKTPAWIQLDYYSTIDTLLIYGSEENYVAPTPPTSIFDDMFNALFFGSGMWLGLSLMLLILLTLLFKWKETGFVTLPITFLFGLEYFNRDLGIEALIVWSVMMFEAIYLAKTLISDQK